MLGHFECFDDLIEPDSMLIMSPPSLRDCSAVFMDSTNEEFIAMRGDGLSLIDIPS